MNKRKNVRVKRDVGAKRDTGNKGDKKMFKVQYQYFDDKGYQHTKILERATLKGLISAMNAHLQKVTLYEISHVSYNLFDYDFEKHGEHFKGWKI